ncbi:MAG: hypothetical protein OEN56_08890 [Gemmatimonadota bacterium]|nr:hypothetical protein [Gemmatimonadota bacterium]
MRKLASGLAVAALVIAPAAVSAQVQIGPTLAFHDDFDFGIGATFGAQAPQLGEGIGFMADLIIFFPSTDGVDYFEINGNVTYDFPLENSTVLPFALGGLNIARASVDAGTLGSVSNTEIGLNLGGGIVFDAGSFRPAVGGRFEVNGGEGFVLFATLPFQVGNR